MAKYPTPIENSSGNDQMANMITCIRIVCSLALIFCPVFSEWFYVFYMLGGVSDVLDGIAARHFGKETRFGAQFDSIADILFIVIVIVKAILPFPIPTWLRIWIGCIGIRGSFQSIRS